MDQDVRPLGESIFSSSPFCFRVARVFRGSTCFFPFNVSKAGFVLAVSYLGPWSFICGSIAVFGFSRRSATPDQMIGCGPWAEAHGYHRSLAPRDGENRSTFGLVTVLVRSLEFGDFGPGGTSRD